MAEEPKEDVLNNERLLAASLDRIMRGEGLTYSNAERFSKKNWEQPKVTKPCSLDPELTCRLRGGCPRVLNIEVLPMSEENKKARASWCECGEKRQ